MIFYFSLSLSKKHVLKNNSAFCFLQKDGGKRVDFEIDLAKETITAKRSTAPLEANCYDGSYGGPDQLGSGPVGRPCLSCSGGQS